MSESTNRPIVYAFPSGSIALGVFWYTWGLYGFWWGLVYGAFWPMWIGYRLAEYLLPVSH